ncbi:MAG: hypothetical protein HJJLKODD_00261 [Phycisphaerae bacterium]|nr:hypothetical protein [Phycisphaerae bacterium]
MKTKTLIPLFLGVVVGGIAIKLVVDVVSNADAATRANIARCVVAKVDINGTEEVTADKLEIKEWPKDMLPQDHFKKIEELNGRVADVTIIKGLPVYGSMLAPEGTAPGLQTRIPKGYLAISTPIDEVSGVAYQMKSGDRVDVVALVKVRSADGQRVDQISRVILQNIEIAAVGRTQEVTKEGTKSTKTVARSATLLLKPEQATQLHLAQSMGGKISLALRGSTDDTSDGDMFSATMDQLAGRLPSCDEPKADEPKEVKPTPAEILNSLQASKPKVLEKSWIVKVIRGNEIVNVKYHEVNGRWEEIIEDEGARVEPAADAVPEENPTSAQPDYGQSG